MLANTGHIVTVWSAIEKEIEEYSKARVHSNLPGMKILDSIVFTESISDVCENKDVLIFAVPSVYVRSAAKDVAKGIGQGTLYTMTEVIRDELNTAGKQVKMVALSGSTHAEEVVPDMLTIIVSACDDLTIAEYVQDIFMRVYTNSDMRGVELCGAMKNIIALAVGISAGLGYGDNAEPPLSHAVWKKSQGLELQWDDRSRHLQDCLV